MIENISNNSFLSCVISVIFLLNLKYLKMLKQEKMIKIIKHILIIMIKMYESESWNRLKQQTIKIVKINPDIEKIDIRYNSVNNEQHCWIHKTRKYDNTPGRKAMI